MKKRKCGIKGVLMLLCLFCLLTGCNKQKDISGDNRQEPLAQETEALATEAPEEHQQSNTVYWASSLGTRTYGREGSFYSESNRIYFFDAATGESDIICDDATCTHKRNECSAYFDGTSYVALEDDHLLVVTTYGSDTGWTMQLYTADVNGSNRKHVAELAFMSSIYQILFTEDKIIASFWNSVDENLEPIEENYAGIYVFDRKTNTGEVVWSKQALNAIAAHLNYYNNVVYFDMLYYDVTMDEVTGYGMSSDYVTERKRYELCALDLTDKSLTILHEGDWETFTVCGEKVWFADDESLWSYDIASGEKKKALPRAFRIELSYGTDRLFLRDAEKYYNYYTYQPGGTLMECGTKAEVLPALVYPEITWANNFNTPTGNGETIYWDTKEFMNGGKAVKTPTPEPTKAATATPEPTKSLEIPKNVQTVTWVLPDTIQEKYYAPGVERLNKKLLEDGYPFALKIVTYPRTKYRTQVVPMIESGEADIVSVGVDMEDGSRGGYSQDFIRKGYFEDLSGYLTSEKGRILHDWYTKDEWEKVETDGKNYVIPFQGAVYGSAYFAFNKSYVTEGMLSGFDGTLESLEQLLNSLEVPKGVYPILGGFSNADVAVMCGKTEEEGVLFDLKTGAAENPFDNEAFYQSLKKINTWYLDGTMEVFEGMDSQERERQAVRSGKFVVWIGYRQDAFYEEVRDTVITVPLNFTIVNALSTCNGINKNSDSKETALELLSLLYTEADYANMLLYGEEGTDYYLEDGYVYKPDGTPWYRNWGEFGLGLYDTALPGQNESLKDNRRVFKNAHYASGYYVDSAVQGFQPDFTVFADGVPGAVGVLSDCVEIWKEKDFDAAWEKAAQEYKDADGEEMVEELNKQVSEWMNLYR